MADELVEAITKMREPQALGLAAAMLEQGADPMQVLGACRQAVEVVGKRFEKGEYFLPELIMAGEMLKKISEIAKPFFSPLSGTRPQRLAKIVIGTVKGDIHDIGKDIVAFLLDVNGFEVHDLGIDVPPPKFVEAIKNIQPQVVGMSALLTVAFESLKSTVEAINAAGLRGQVKLMVGGGGVDEQVRRYAGADAYGKDAVAAVSLAQKWTRAG